MKRLDRDCFHWPDTPDELQKDFLFPEGLIFLVFMRLFLYNKGMKTNDFEPIFTDEQLHKMSKENLAQVILLMQKQQTVMQKQQSKLEEKVSDLQKKQKKRLIQT